jgi:hypothetical protein
MEPETQPGSGERVATPTPDEAIAEMQEVVGAASEFFVASADADAQGVEAKIDFGEQFLKSERVIHDVMHRTVPGVDALFISMRYHPDYKDAIAEANKTFEGFFVNGGKVNPVNKKGDAWLDKRYRRVGKFAKALRGSDYRIEGRCMLPNNWDLLYEVTLAIENDPENVATHVKEGLLTPNSTRNDIREMTAIGKQSGKPPVENKPSRAKAPAQPPPTTVDGLTPDEQIALEKLVSVGAPVEKIAEAKAAIIASRPKAPEAPKSAPSPAPEDGENDDEPFMVECPKCEGTGKTDNGKECRLCHGTGEVEDDEPVISGVADVTVNEDGTATMTRFVPNTATPVTNDPVPMDFTPPSTVPTVEYVQSAAPTVEYVDVKPELAAKTLQWMAKHAKAVVVRKLKNADGSVQLLCTITPDVPYGKFPPALLTALDKGETATQ